MSEINEDALWEEKVSLILRGDRVEGGRGGAANIQASQLANRTLFLKQAVESIREDREFTFYVTEDDPEGVIKGISGTQDGEYFRVLKKNGAATAFSYYRNVKNIAVYQNSTPSDFAYQVIMKALGDVSGAVYKGDGAVTPSIVDSANRLIFGYDANADSVVGLFYDVIDRVISGESQHVGAGMPVAIDAMNKILFGYHSEKDTFLGAFYDDENRVAGGEVIHSGEGDVIPWKVDSMNRVLLGWDVKADCVIAPGLGGERKFYPSWQNEKFPHTMIKKAINQCFYYGQSNAIGTKGTPVLTTSRPFSNLMFSSGVLGTTYASLVRCVEASLETGAATMCNYLNLAGYRENGVSVDSFTSLVSAPGSGGARISWLNKGSSRYNNYLIPQMSAGYAINNDLQIDTFAWIQGEADSGDGSYHIETVEGYKQLFLGLVNNVNSDAKAATGQETPVVFLTYQHSTYVVEGNTHEAFLQSEAADNRVYVIVPTYIFPHAADNLHLNNVGYKWMGAYFGRARKQIMLDGIKPKRIRPVSAIFAGKKISVRFRVPVAPLVFDTTTLKPTTSYGFSVRVNGVLTEISSLEIVNGDTVELNMSEGLNGASVEVRYAYDYNGTTLKQGGSGNLIDSCSDNIDIGGVPYPMPYVTPHFKINAVNGEI